MRHFSVRRAAAVTFLAAATLAPLVGPAGAASTVQSFQVRINIGLACTVSATTLDFGISGVLAAAIDVASSLTVTCGNGTPYKVALSQGAGIGATPDNRLMTGPGGSTVRYSLYQNSARSVRWADVFDSDLVFATGTGLAQAFPVYGRVFQQATPGPGAYADNITVTVTY